MDIFGCHSHSVGRQHICPTAPTILLKFTQIVFLVHTSLRFMIQEHRAARRVLMDTPFQPQEDSRDGPAGRDKEEAFSCGAADQSSQMFTDAKSAMTCGLHHKSCWSIVDPCPQGTGNSGHPQKTNGANQLQQGYKVNVQKHILSYMPAMNKWNWTFKTILFTSTL